MQGFHQKALSIGLVLVVFLLLLASSAPARLLNPALALWFPQLVVANSSGTIWHGKAMQAWFRHEGRSAALGELEWQLSPLSLLLLHPRLELQTRAAAQSLTTRLSASPGGEVRVSELRARFPLSILKPWYPLLLDGLVSIDVAALVYHRNWLQQLDGSMELDAAQWRLGRNSVLLGDYRAQLAMAGEDVLARLSDDNANLGIEGTVQLAEDGAYQADVLFQERAASVAPIFQFLSMIGTANGAGSLAIKSRGNIHGRAGRRQ